MKILSVIIFAAISVDCAAATLLRAENCDSKIEIETFKSDSSARYIVKTTGVMCQAPDEICQSSEPVQHRQDESRSDIDDVKIIQPGEAVKYRSQIYKCE